MLSLLLSLPSLFTCSMCHEVVCVTVSFFLPNMLSKEEWTFTMRTSHKEHATAVLRKWHENLKSDPPTHKRIYHLWDKSKEYDTILDVPRSNRPLFCEDQRTLYEYSCGTSSGADPKKHLCRRGLFNWGLNIIPWDSQFTGYVHVYFMCCSKTLMISDSSFAR